MNEQCSINKESGSTLFDNNAPISLLHEGGLCAFIKGFQAADYCRGILL